MGFPNLLKVIVTGAGESLAAAFTKANANVDSVSAWGLAQDATNTQLQQAIAALTALIYAAPPGNYKAPPAGGAQSYSGNGGTQPWTQATFTGRLMIALASASGSMAAGSTFHADAWDGSSFFAVTAQNNTSPALLSRIAVANGVPSLAAQAQLSGNTGNSNPIHAAVATTPTALRLLQGSQGATTVYDHLVTFANNALSVSASVSNVSPLLASSNRRGILLGTTSWLMFGVSGQGLPYLHAAYLHDRAGNSSYEVSSATWSPASYTTSQDNIGGGFVVRGGASFSVPDGGTRPALILEYFAETGGVQRLATLRVPNPATFAGWTTVVALSGTLVVAQYKDLSGNYYSIAASVATALSQAGVASGSLGLYGPYSGGLLATVLSYPLLYSPTVAAFFRPTSSGACKLSRMVFNPAAAPGSELTMTAANDVALSIGTAQANGQTAIPGLTSVALVNAFMNSNDQLVVVYSAQATTPAFYCDVFTLA